MHSTANLPLLPILKKFNFFLKTHPFLQKSQVSYVVEKFSFLIANLLSFSDKKFSKSKPSNVGQFNIGHYQMASGRLKTFTLSGGFSFHFLNIEENKKSATFLKKFFA